MATTITATLLKKFKSIARAIATTTNTVSAEVITLNHLLGRCPDFIFAVIRTITAGNNQTIGQPVFAAVRSWNASQVILDVTAPGIGQASGSPVLSSWDVVSEYTFSLQR